MMKLDCNACKGEKTMEPTAIPRFNTILRVIGVLIVLPSLFGILVSAIMFFSAGSMMTGAMEKATTESAQAGVAIGSSIGFGVAIFFGATSLVGGIIGWVLLMKRKVYKCIKCGFIIDRA